MILMARGVHLVNKNNADILSQSARNAIDETLSLVLEMPVSP